MNRTICAAIAGRKLIRFDYGGLERLVEPHAHGFNANRKEVIRGFQVDGESRSRESVGWKFFMLSKMTDVVVLPSDIRESREGRDEAAHELIITHCGTQ